MYALPSSVASSNFWFSRPRLYHVRIIYSLTLCFALEQCLVYVHFLLVIVQFIRASEINRSVHLLGPVPSITAFAVLSACSLSSMPTWPGTQWTSAFTSRSTSLCILSMNNWVNRCTGPGAVYWKFVIAAWELV